MGDKNMSGRDGVKTEENEGPGEQLTTVVSNHQATHEGGQRVIF